MHQAARADEMQCSAAGRDAAALRSGSPHAVRTPWFVASAALGAVAVGLINSTGNLGGFAGPYVMGFLKVATKSYTAGLIYLVVAAVLAGALVLRVDLERLGEVG